MADDSNIEIVIPTAINVLLLVNENIVSNLRKGQISDLTLPSLYKRAFLVVNETDEVAIAKQGESA
jgi:hypothetical protein